MSSQDLQARVKALEEELNRLKAHLRGGEIDSGVSSAISTSTKDIKPQEVDENSLRKKKRGADKPFDFSAHPHRHVALRLAYLGWHYQGFAVQENTDNTVEARLFEALLKTKLIQERQTSNYHRCGRTDKGVSAFSQVISIDLRSSQFGGGLGVTLPTVAEHKAKDTADELPYVKILNRVLPPDIRILQWAPVETGFSARFDCQSRTYRYYFPRGDLDVKLMAEAAKRYEGTHDFRNLCKMDVGNGVLQFQRTIISANVQPAQIDPNGSSDSHQLYVFQVKGLAFLYHQVRCMMALLLLIGQKLESPEIIDQLMDVDTNPRKPQYSMAVDYPLVLYDCHFEGVNWRNETEEEKHIMNSLHQHWVQNAVKTQVLLGMIQGLQTTNRDTVPLQCWLMEGSRQKKYQALLERPRCESLESRIQHFVKRGRLEQEEGENGEETMVFRGKRSKQSHQTASISHEVKAEVSS
ncbi:hypothetical protein DNTS_035006 [Danionella cerebrum]|uniref:Pseudouridine synthase I TruA alpha/beta domain-containing protein n=1 Tax=Danionella cerebrum TaxID=2873325 RepID=A0A553R7L7_9TELE|nr:hypothetical protein DNTS_035006 [Danionella translucida]